jgi:uncharacterized Zn-finger protein
MLLNKYKENKPICPYCDYSFNSDDMYNSGTDMWYETCDDEVKCPLCDQTFYLTIETQYLYTSSQEDEYGYKYGEERD